MTVEVTAPVAGGVVVTQGTKTAGVNMNRNKMGNEQKLNTK